MGASSSRWAGEVLVRIFDHDFNIPEYFDISMKSGFSYRPRSHCCALGRGNHRHAAADEVSHERGQPIVLAVEPMVLDRHVLAFDDAGPVEVLRNAAV
jgi:hypothetical protein